MVARGRALASPPTNRVATREPPTTRTRDAYRFMGQLAEQAPDQRETPPFAPKWGRQHEQGPSTARPAGHFLPIPSRRRRFQWRDVSCRVARRSPTVARPWPPKRVRSACAPWQPRACRTHRRGRGGWWARGSSTRVDSPRDHERFQNGQSMRTRCTILGSSDAARPRGGCRHLPALNPGAALHPWRTIARSGVLPQVWPGGES